jgi:hypothetical protein
MSNRFLNRLDQKDSHSLAYSTPKNMKFETEQKASQDSSVMESLAYVAPDNARTLVASV